MTLILASASAIRRSMLEQVGLAFTVVPAKVDEDKVKARIDGAAQLAETLAMAKALDVSRGGAGWVIGSDSVASVEGRRFNKPASQDDAREHLHHFSGRSLELTSSVALARNGEVEWSATDSATLRVRALSPAFIDDYLDAEWPEVGYCVGVFRLEGRGVQLFDAIEGSYFTILGLPLLPLLGALRDRGVIPS